MNNYIKKKIKYILTIYVKKYPVKINDYWFFTHQNNVELIIPILFGNYEKSSTKFFKKYIKKGWVVCDVGAYIGYHTTLFSKLVGPKGRVICIEPVPSHYSLLTKNIIRNNLKNVVALNLAASNKNAYGEIYSPLVNSPDSILYKLNDQKRKASKVTLKTIDEILKNEKRVNLIKIDVQGWEEKTLIGAKNTLKKNPNLALYIEFWPEGLTNAGTRPLHFLKYIQKLGFTINFFDENSKRLIKASDLNKLIDITLNTDGKFIDLLCVKKSLRPNTKF